MISCQDNNVFGVNDLTALPKGAAIFLPRVLPHTRRASATVEMFAFRQRMQTEDSKVILRRRPSITEFPNAECCYRRLQQFRIRSLAKVRIVASDPRSHPT